MRTSPRAIVALLSITTTQMTFAVSQDKPTPSISGDTKYWAYEAASSDEFDGSGAISASKWTEQLGEWKGTPPGAFKQGNAAISENSLVLTTKEDADFSPAGITENCECGFEDISTPLVVSTAELTFGFYEIRAKMAKASLLSSFWLQGASGEINILDTVPASANNGLKVSNNYHCFDPAGDGSLTNDDEMSIADLLDPSDDFHTYGVERDSSGVKFYVDSKLVRTLTSNDANCLEQPMNVIFSMETIENEGIPSAFNSHTSSVEYFRFWTHSTAPPGCDGVSGSGKVDDACNVCGGDGKSCAGCDGVSNSGKVNDACNVCGGDGKSCAGCDSVANSGKVNDACNVCDGDGKSCAGCDGVANSGKVNDACNVCGGDGSSCTTKPPSGPARKTCAELGWKVGLTMGDKSVCGESDDKLGANGAKQCISNKNFEQAQSVCSAAGARLCTTAELTAQITKGSGCGFDNKMVWTSEKCADGYTVAKGKDGTSTQCMPTSDATVEVRCCSDVAIVGLLSASMSGTMFGKSQAEGSVSGSDSGVKGGASTSATVAAALGCAVFVLGALAAVVMRRRNAGATGADTDAGAPAGHNEEGDAELGVVQDNLSDVIAEVVLERRESVDAPAGMDENAFVLTDEGSSIRMKSVKRGNPLYVQSVYMDSSEHRPASMAFSSDM